MWKAFDINSIQIERDMLRVLATVSAKTEKKIAVHGVETFLEIVNGRIIYHFSKYLID